MVMVGDLFLHFCHFLGKLFKTADDTLFLLWYFIFSLLLLLYLNFRLLLSFFHCFIPFFPLLFQNEFLGILCLLVCTLLIQMLLRGLIIDSFAREFFFLIKVLFTHDLNTLLII